MQRSPCAYVMLAWSAPSDAVLWRFLPESSLDNCTISSVNMRTFPPSAPAFPEISVLLVCVLPPAVCYWLCCAIDEKSQELYYWFLCIVESQNSLSERSSFMTCQSDFHCPSLQGSRWEGRTLCVYISSPTSVRASPGYLSTLLWSYKTQHSKSYWE